MFLEIHPFVAPWKALSARRSEHPDCDLTKLVKQDPLDESRSWLLKDVRPHRNWPVSCRDLGFGNNQQTGVARTLLFPFNW
jgi:hypothetical protein